MLFAVQPDYIYALQCAITISRIYFNYEFSLLPRGASTISFRFRFRSDSVSISFRFRFAAVFVLAPAIFHWAWILKANTARNSYLPIPSVRVPLYLFPFVSLAWQFIELVWPCLMFLNSVMLVGSVEPENSMPMRAPFVIKCCSWCSLKAPQLRVVPLSPIVSVHVGFIHLSINLTCNCVSNEPCWDHRSTPGLLISSMQRKMLRSCKRIPYHGAVTSIANRN